MSLAPPQNRTTLRVLPFDSLGDADAPEYFVRGFVEDLVTDLSRFDLTVLAPPPSAPSPDSRYGDFELSGGLRRAGGRLRVTARLSCPETGEVLWAERFDRSTEDVFEVQDEISARVAASVSSRINATLLARARRKPKTERGVYDLWLAGIAELKQGSARADQQARDLFQRALAGDPDYSRAYVGLSLSYFNEWSCQLWQRWDENECRAFEYAERAERLDPDDHHAQLVLGRVLLFRREFERAESHLLRSLSLNENDADCLVQVGVGLAYLGHAERGFELYERALSINPYHEPWYHAYGGVVAFSLERYQTALELFARLPGNIMVDLPAYRAVAQHHLGHADAARDCLAHYLAEFQEKIAVGREPEAGEALRWLGHVNPYRSDRDEQRLLEGVRAVSERAGSEPPAFSRTPSRLAFRQQGSLWQISFEGRDSWLPPLKGFADLRLLLESAGRELHASEIMGRADASAGGDAVDAKAIAAYRRRAVELREETSEARAMNDVGRATRLAEELEALSEHLSQSLGLGGRSRKLGAPQERARSAVTQRIRAAIKKISEVNEPLARHLQDAVQTGTFCSYRPQTPMPWNQ